MEENSIDIEVHFDPRNDEAIEPKEITRENEVSGLGFDDHGFSEDIEGRVILFTTNGKTWEWKVVTISNYQEFDRRTCHKEIHLPWCDRERIPYPCLYRRNVKLEAFLRLTYSGDDYSDELGDAIKDCAKAALAVAVPLVIAGQFAAAGVAFVESLKTCLIAKGIQYVGRFKADAYTRKHRGPWQRV